MATVTMSTVILPRAPKGVFRNEPFTNFLDSPNEHGMQAALHRIGDQLGHEYALIIGGESMSTSSNI